MGLTKPEKSLLATLERQLDEIADRAARALGALDQYAVVRDESFIDDLRETVSIQFRLFLEGVRAGHPLEDEIRCLALDIAKRRVEQGLTLAGLLRGVGVAQRCQWESIMRATTAEGVSAASITTIAARWVEHWEIVTGALSTGYVNEQIHRLAHDEQAKRDLVEDLLSGNVQPDQERRAAAFGVGIGPPAVVVVGAVGRPGVGVDTALRHRAALILSANLPPDVQPLVVPRREEVVGILPNQSSSLAERLRRTVQEFAGEARLPLWLGVSRPSDSLRGIAGAYDEARAALGHADNARPVAWLSELSLREHLVGSADALTRSLVSPRVADLVQADSVKGYQLVETLLAYLDEDLSVPRAAHRLMVHPNTVYYRLERISTRTGRDVRRFHDLLELTLEVEILMKDERRGEADGANSTPGIGGFSNSSGAKCGDPSVAG